MTTDFSFEGSDMSFGLIILIQFDIHIVFC